MKKWLVLLLLLISCGRAAADRPFRQRIVSPDKHWTAIVEKLASVWQLCLLDNRTDTKDYLTAFRSDNGADRADDAFGIYDFCWSPDSKLIFFVFQAHTDSTISHVCDSFAIVDLKTGEYDWVAGYIVDQMELELYGEPRPDFRLSWPSNSQISFYLPRARLARLVGKEYKTVKIKPAGRRVVSVAGLQRRFTENASKIRSFVLRLRQLMQRPDWKQKIVPLMPLNKADAQSSLEILETNRSVIVNMKRLTFAGYNAAERSFSVSIYSSGPFPLSVVISKGRILYIPYD